jgi:hypothetical protein
MAASLVGQSRYFNDSDGSNNVAKTLRELQQTLKFVKGGSQGLC